jgi:hypothetical protein
LIRSFGVGEAVRPTEGGRDPLELVAALLVEIFFEPDSYRGSFGLRLLRFQYGSGWTPV